MSRQRNEYLERLEGYKIQFRRLKHYAGIVSIDREIERLKRLGIDYPGELVHPLIQAELFINDNSNPKELSIEERKHVNENMFRRNIEKGRNQIISDFENEKDSFLEMREKKEAA